MFYMRNHCILEKKAIGHNQTKLIVWDIVCNVLYQYTAYTHAHTCLKEKPDYSGLFDDELNDKKQETII